MCNNCMTYHEPKFEGISIMAKEKKMWIKEAIKHPGSLHKALHVKEGEKIPAAKLKKAEHSKSSSLKKKAVLAETLSHLRKKK